MHCNIADCPAAIPDDKLEIHNIEMVIKTEASYDEALQIEYVCKSNYDKLYLGDFVYKCQEDGTWNNKNVLQCLNSQLLFLLFLVFSVCAVTTPLRIKFSFQVLIFCSQYKSFLGL